jgi:hypothetical protein
MSVHTKFGLAVHTSLGLAIEGIHTRAVWCPIEVVCTGLVLAFRTGFGLSGEGLRVASQRKWGRQTTEAHEVDTPGSLAMDAEG